MAYPAAISNLSFSLKLSLGRFFFKRLFFLIIFFVILPLLSFYLFQMGELVRAIWTEKLYIQQLRELSQTKVFLQQEASQVLGLEKVEREIKNLGFVKVSEVSYIPISPEYLAKE